MVRKVKKKAKSRVKKKASKAKPEVKKSRNLKPNQIMDFKKSYGRYDEYQLAEKFNLTAKRVTEYGTEYALAKDKDLFADQKMPRWSEEEIETLVSMHTESSNLEIAVALGRSAKAIVAKASKLGLRKSEERIQRMGASNVAPRYVDL